MRIIVMGTGPFAVPTIERLRAEGQHEIMLVVTRPPVASKAKKVPSRPVFKWATEHGFDLYEPESINAPEAIEKLASYAADLFFVCDYGQILSSDCLTAARLGGINLHGSLLPRHRGAAPVQWTLLRGDDLAGVTVIHMTPRLDAGPALEIASTKIREDETAGELEPRLAEVGVAASLSAIDRLSKWDPTSSKVGLGEVQDQSFVTKAPRFAKSDGALDFRLPAEYLVRLVRACQPWPGTFAELRWPNNKRLRVIVRRARSLLSSTMFEDSDPPGSIRQVSADELGKQWEEPWDVLLAVKTEHGTFLISRLQPAGKREMTAGEFVRGHSADAGVQFRLPDPPAKVLA